MTRGELIDRLEKAGAGSSELDAEIEISLLHPSNQEYARKHGIVAHDYTTSVTDALLLIKEHLPGWWWEVDASGNATLFKAPRYVIENAATPALALCLAALKSLGARDKTAI